MKRLIKANTSDLVPTLHIIIDITEYTADVVASSLEFKEMQHPSIKRKFKKSDDWLKEVNDLARSIYGSMISRKFSITKCEPSKKSYTYYIRFQPADKNGDLWDAELELQIELRDHPSETHDDLGQVTHDLFVKTYYLDDAEYKNMMDLFRAIRKILDDLQQGDFSSFMN